MSDLKKWAHDVTLYSRIYETILNLRIVGSDLSVKTPRGENVYDLPASLFAEKQRIESEWNFKRLLTIRRVIFEKFVDTPVYQSYLFALKSSSESTAAATSATSSGVYGYFSWSLNSVRDYYYGSMPANNASEIITSSTGACAFFFCY